MRGSRITRMDLLVLIIRFNRKERGFTVPSKRVQKGLVRGTLNTEQIKEGGNYFSQLWGGWWWKYWYNVHQARLLGTE